MDGDRKKVYTSCLSQTLIREKSLTVCWIKYSTNHSTETYFGLNRIMTEASETTMLFVLFIKIFLCTCHHFQKCLHPHRNIKTPRCCCNCVRCLWYCNTLTNVQQNQQTLQLTLTPTSCGSSASGFCCIYSTNKHYCIVADVVDTLGVLSLTRHASVIRTEFAFCFTTFY